MQTNSTITAATILAPGKQKVEADASGGSFTVTFSPCDKWIGTVITIINVGTSNLVTWRMSDGDTAEIGGTDGEAASGTLAPGDRLTMIATEG